MGLIAVMKMVGQDQPVGQLARMEHWFPALPLNQRRRISSFQPCIMVDTHRVGGLSTCLFDRILVRLLHDTILCSGRASLPCQSLLFVNRNASADEVAAAKRLSSLGGFL